MGVVAGEMEEVLEGAQLMVDPALLDLPLPAAVQRHVQEGVVLWQMSGTETKSDLMFRNKKSIYKKITSMGKM